MHGLLDHLRVGTNVSGDLGHVGPDGTQELFDFPGIAKLPRTSSGVYVGFNQNSASNFFLFFLASRSARMASA